MYLSMIKVRVLKTYKEHHSNGSILLFFVHRVSNLYKIVRVKEVLDFLVKLLCPLLDFASKY